MPNPEELRLMLDEMEKACQMAFHYHARRAADRAFWQARIETIKQIRGRLT